MIIMTVRTIKGGQHSHTQPNLPLQMNTDRDPFLFLIIALASQFATTRDPVLLKRDTMSQPEQPYMLCYTDGNP